MAGSGKTPAPEEPQDSGQSPPAAAAGGLDDEKLMADVEQFLYFHRYADLTAEVLQVRLLLAMFKLLKSMARD